MTVNAQVIGRAKTALVFQDGDQRAVISVIIVRRRKPSRRHLRFLGTVEFSKSVKNHIKKVILPIINRILRQLELAEKNFEISAVNIGAASAMDIGVHVSGLSADVPVFVAMLSEALQIPLSDDFVTTGHIASVEGDISAVKGIPAKIEAAKNDGSIKRFLYPDFEKDGSLKVLSPNEENRSIDAIMAVRDSLHTGAVSGIGQLSRLVFTEEGIVLASLREGFFDTSKIPAQFNNPLQDVISFLTRNNEKRFWDILEYHFLKGRCEKYKELLEAFVQFFLGKKRYPKGFGAKLFQLVCLLSLANGKLKIDFPIIDKGLCLKLKKLAQESDYDDTRLLSDAADGTNVPAKADICSISDPTGIETDSENRVFHTIVSLINEQALAQKFGVIDSARACFILESLRVESYEELINTLQAYYIHLQRYVGSSPEVPDMGEARSETIKLLERTFYDKGDDKAAFVRARDCTQGGIRSILDMMTEQYKAEKQAAYINRVFKDAVADMDWEERIKCIRAIIKEVGRFLPEGLKDQPPERFARSDETIETIIRTYVRCSDKFNQSLSSM